MILINKHNYEAYFLDFYEGELNDDQQKEVLKFVELHPELKEEFEAFGNTKLSPAATTFDWKEELKDNVITSDIDNWIIACLEDDLDEYEKERLGEHLEKNDDHLLLIHQYSQCKLKAPNIVFHLKDEIKKSPKVIPLWSYATGVAVAASIGLLIFFGINPNSLEPTNMMADKTENKRTFESKLKSENYGYWIALNDLGDSKNNLTRESLSSNRKNEPTGQGNSKTGEAIAERNLNESPQENAHNAIGNSASYASAENPLSKKETQQNESSSVADQTSAQNEALVADQIESVTEEISLAEITKPDLINNPSNPELQTGSSNVIEEQIETIQNTSNKFATEASQKIAANHSNNDEIPSIGELALQKMKGIFGLNKKDNVNLKSAAGEAIADRIPNYSEKENNGRKIRSFKLGNFEISRSVASL